MIALTFDDGPGPSSGALLDALGEHGVRATFFLLGCHIASWPELAMRMAKEGHVLGNHTYSHADALTPPEMVDEIARTDRLIQDCYRRAGRRDEPKIPFRLPYGLDGPNGEIRHTIAVGLGRPHVHWTGKFGDWEPRRHDEIAAEMVEHVNLLAQARLHAVLLLHDAAPPFDKYQDRSPTVAAVRSLLRTVNRPAEYFALE